MYIMLFTSGTTNEPKAVMLSQNNICSNISAIAKHVKLYKTDTLLSFLPIHHTFEKLGWSETDIVRLFYVVGFILGTGALVYGVWY